MERLRPVDVLDLVVAAALTLAAEAEIWAPALTPGVGPVEGDRAFLTVTTLVMTLPLAVRRRHPLPAGCLVLAAASVQQLAGTPTEGLSSLAALGLAAYSLGAYLEGWKRWAGLAVTVAGGACVGGTDAFFLLLVLLAAWLAGMVIGRRTRRVHSLETDNAALHQQRQEAAVRGAAEERRRIARELHDVVSHRVSMMVVQAQAADALLDSDPERARAAIRATESSGRKALAELRTLLGLLRTDPSASTAQLSPQPTLSDLADLVRQAQDAGVPVTLDCAALDEVPPYVAAAAYRVVQESLTNVLKHGDRAPTCVTLEKTDDTLVVSVLDDGPAAPDGEPGFGLAGMRERVAFIGGTLDAGPRPEGGFAVRAHLPVQASS